MVAVGGERETLGPLVLEREKLAEPREKKEKEKGKS